MEERLHEIQRALADADIDTSEQVRSMMQKLEDMARESHLVGAQGHLQAAVTAYTRDASNCFEAIRLLKEAVVICDNCAGGNLNYIVLKNALKHLMNKIRDSLIIRTQRCVQMGQPEVFKDMLHATHGGGGIASLDEWSQLMQSYEKQIRQRFPVEAFPTKRKHKRCRPRKKRG